MASGQKEPLILHGKKESIDLQDLSADDFGTRGDKKELKGDFLSEEMEGKIGLLLSATSRNNLQKMLALIRGGVPADAADYDKRTALHLAAAEGHATAVKLLLEEGANPNMKDRFGHTPLDEAVRAGHAEIVDFLTSKGGHYGALDELEKELIQASSDGNIDRVRQILKAGGVSPNCADYDARYPLHLAVANGHTAMVKLLLDAKADPKVSDRFGLTPIADAVRRAARVGNDPIRDLFKPFMDAHSAPILSKFVMFFALFQAIMIVLFGLFVRYDEYSDGHSDPTPSINITGADGAAVKYDPSLAAYPFYQDVHVMIFIGFGFLMVFLRKHGYGSVGFTFLVAALTIQWYILLRGFWNGVFNGFGQIHMSILDSLINADFAAGAVLITFGVIIGKVSPFQLLFISIVETVFYALNERISLKMGITDIGGTMVIHMFGAFFGMSLSLALDSRKRTESFSFLGETYKNSSASTRKILDKMKDDVTFADQNTSDNAAVYHSDIFAMVGTVFLWLYWPSFNGATGNMATQHRAVINTLLSLTGSVISAFLSSHALRRQGKFNMVDVQNATLAGGVAMGTCANLIIYPASAIGIGCFAGFVSVAGFAHVQKWLETKIGLQDTCGVNNLHGMPSLIGAIAGIIACGAATFEEYGTGDNSQGYLIFPEWKNGRQPDHQALWQFCFILITIGISCFTGLLTGLLARQTFFEPVQPKYAFLDDPHWEVPELETPYYFDHRGEVIREKDEHHPALKGHQDHEFSQDRGFQASIPVIKDLRDKISLLEARTDALRAGGGRWPNEIRRQSRPEDSQVQQFSSAAGFPPYPPYPYYMPPVYAPPPQPHSPLFQTHFPTSYPPSGPLYQSSISPSGSAVNLHQSSPPPLVHSSSGPIGKPDHSKPEETKRFETMLEAILKKIDHLEKDKEKQPSPTLSPTIPRSSPQLTSHPIAEHGTRSSGSSGSLAGSSTDGSHRRGASRQVSENLGPTVIHKSSSVPGSSFGSSALDGSGRGDRTK